MRFGRWLGRILRACIIAAASAFSIVIACVGLGVLFRVGQALVMSVPVLSFKSAVVIIAVVALITAVLGKKGK